MRSDRPDMKMTDRNAEPLGDRRGERLRLGQLILIEINVGVKIPDRRSFCHHPHLGMRPRNPSFVYTLSCVNLDWGMPGVVMREPGQIGRAPRIASHHRATLIDANGREMPGIVTDISKGGFRIKTDEPLMIGECLRVRVDRYGVGCICGVWHWIVMLSRVDHA